MTTAAEQPASRAVAPWRHTLILCAILLGIAGAGFASSSMGGSAPAQPAAPSLQASGLILYPVLILAELALFLAVRRGLRARGVRAAELISARPLTLRTLAFDLVLGIGLFCSCTAGLLLLHGTNSATPANVQRLLVHHAIEIPLWLLVSLAAGVVEEFVFRGYLQRQFASRLGTAGGILIQALLFGVVHGYQGWEPLLGITLLGLAFGVTAAARRSLIPAMVAHTLIDVVGGLQILR